MGTFSVTIEHRGGTVLVRPSGDLDLLTAPRLEQALVGALREDRAVLVDLSDVPFADCAGLRPIRRAIEGSTASAAKVRMVGARPKVERVLRLTGFRA
jgi:anti-sigma B factor antagonist